MGLPVSWGGLTVAVMPPTIERLQLTVEDVTYPLAPTERLEPLKAAIREAVRAGGDFVEVTLDDGRHLSIYLAGTFTVIVAVDTVHLDTRHADGPQDEFFQPAPGSVFDQDYPFDII